MPTYRLHYFPESGNSYKLALMLTLCGQSFEGVWTDFGGGITRTPEWRRDVNEMGEIPVLVVDGERLTQTAPTDMPASAATARCVTRSSPSRPMMRSVASIKGRSRSLAFRSAVGATLTSSARRTTEDRTTEQMFCLTDHTYLTCCPQGRMDA